LFHHEGHEEHEGEAGIDADTPRGLRELRGGNYELRDGNHDIHSHGRLADRKPFAGTGDAHKRALVQQERVEVIKRIS